MGSLKRFEQNTYFNKKEKKRKEEGEKEGEGRKKGRQTSREGQSEPRRPVSVLSSCSIVGAWKFGKMYKDEAGFHLTGDSSYQEKLTTNSNPGQDSPQLSFAPNYKGLIHNEFG